SGVDRPAKPQVLLEDPRARAGHAPIEQSRQDRLSAQGLRGDNSLFRFSRAGLEVVRIDISRDEGHRLDVGLCYRALDRDRLADLDLIESDVGVVALAHCFISVTGA